jgi:8-oxo-dGTP pyrophosphatase MutT (NUDIX family)
MLFNIKNILRESLISESKKTEYQYQIRDIGGGDVYYKRKKDKEEWDFTDKEEFDKYSTKKNTVKFKPESDKKRISAGILIKSSKDTILLLLRNDPKPTWSLMSGGLKENENPLEGLKREIIEELNIDPEIIEYKKIRTEDNPKSKFIYYEGFVEKEFKPKLNNENLEYGWFKKDKLPSPLYKGLKSRINKI